MVKHTRRRGGTWYDPRTWFSSSSATSEIGAPTPTQSDLGVSPATPAAPASSPYGGRKKSRRGKRRGTKSRRKH
jgi:hypothetical protein